MQLSKPELKVMFGGAVLAPVVYAMSTLSIEVLDVPLQAPLEDEIRLVRLSSIPSTTYQKLPSLSAASSEDIQIADEACAGSMYINSNSTRSNVHDDNTSTSNDRFLYFTPSDASGTQSGGGRHVFNNVTLAESGVYVVCFYLNASGRWTALRGSTARRNSPYFHVWPVVESFQNKQAIFALTSEENITLTIRGNGLATAGPNTTTSADTNEDTILLYQIDANNSDAVQNVSASSSLMCLLLANLSSTPTKTTVIPGSSSLYQMQVRVPTTLRGGEYAACYRGFPYDENMRTLAGDIFIGAVRLVPSAESSNASSNSSSQSAGFVERHSGIFRVSGVSMTIEDSFVLLQVRRDDDDMSSGEDLANETSPSNLLFTELCQNASAWDASFGLQYPLVMQQQQQQGAISNNGSSEQVVVHVPSLHPYWNVLCYRPRPLSHIISSVSAELETSYRFVQPAFYVNDLRAVSFTPNTSTATTNMTTTIGTLADGMGWAAGTRPILTLLDSDSYLGGSRILNNIDSAFLVLRRIAVNKSSLGSNQSLSAAIDDAEEGEEICNVSSSSSIWFAMEPFSGNIPSNSSNMYISNTTIVVDNTWRNTSGDDDGGLTSFIVCFRSYLGLRFTAVSLKALVTVADVFAVWASPQLTTSSIEAMTAGPSYVFTLFANVSFSAAVQGLNASADSVFLTPLSIPSWTTAGLLAVQGACPVVGKQFFGPWSAAPFRQYATQSVVATQDGRDGGELQLLQRGYYAVCWYTSYAGEDSDKPMMLSSTDFSTRANITAANSSVKYYSIRGWIAVAPLPPTRLSQSLAVMNTTIVLELLGGEQVNLMTLFPTTPRQAGRDATGPGAGGDVVFWCRNNSDTSSAADDTAPSVISIKPLTATTFAFTSQRTGSFALCFRSNITGATPRATFIQRVEVGAKVIIQNGTTGVNGSSSSTTLVARIPDGAVDVAVSGTGLSRNDTLVACGSSLSSSATILVTMTSFVRIGETNTTPSSDQLLPSVARFHVRITDTATPVVALCYRVTTSGGISSSASNSTSPAAVFVDVPVANVTLDPIVDNVTCPTAGTNTSTTTTFSAADGGRTSILTTMTWRGDVVTEVLFRAEYRPSAGFIRAARLVPSNTSCSSLSPSAPHVNGSSLSIKASFLLSSSFIVSRRGSYLLCYQGPSGRWFEVANTTIVVKDHGDSASLSQPLSPDAAIVTNGSTSSSAARGALPIFFSGYSVDFAVRGGALNMSLDSYATVTLQSPFAFNSSSGSRLSVASDVFAAFEASADAACRRISASNISATTGGVFLRGSGDVDAVASASSSTPLSNSTVSILSFTPKASTGLFALCRNQRLLPSGALFATISPLILVPASASVVKANGGRPSYVLSLTGPSALLSPPTALRQFFFSSGERGLAGPSLATASTAIDDASFANSVMLYSLPIGYTVYFALITLTTTTTSANSSMIKNTSTAVLSTLSLIINTSTPVETFTSPLNSDGSSATAAAAGRIVLSVPTACLASTIPSYRVDLVSKLALLVGHESISSSYTFSSSLVLLWNYVEAGCTASWTSEKLSDAARANSSLVQNIASTTAVYTMFNDLQSDASTSPQLVTAPLFTFWVLAQILVGTPTSVLSTLTAQQAANLLIQSESTLRNAKVITTQLLDAHLVICSAALDVLLPLLSNASSSSSGQAYVLSRADAIKYQAIGQMILSRTMLIGQKMCQSLASSSSSSNVTTNATTSSSKYKDFDVSVGLGTRSIPTPSPSLNLSVVTDLGAGGASATEIDVCVISTPMASNILPQVSPGFTSHKTFSELDSSPGGGAGFVAVPTSTPAFNLPLFSVTIPTGSAQGSPKELLAKRTSFTVDYTINDLPEAAIGPSGAAADVVFYYFIPASGSNASSQASSGYWRVLPGGASSTLRMIGTRAAVLTISISSLPSTVVTALMDPQDAVLSMTFTGVYAVRSVYPNEKEKDLVMFGVTIGIAAIEIGTVILAAAISRARRAVKRQQAETTRRNQPVPPTAVTGRNEPLLVLNISDEDDVDDSNRQAERKKKKKDHLSSGSSRDGSSEGIDASRPISLRNLDEHDDDEFALVFEDIVNSSDEEDTRRQQQVWLREPSTANRTIGRPAESQSPSRRDHDMSAAEPFESFNGGEGEAEEANHPPQNRQEGGGEREPPKSKTDEGGALPATAAFWWMQHHDASRAVHAAWRVAVAMTTNLSTEKRRSTTFSTSAVWRRRLLLLPSGYELSTKLVPFCLAVLVYMAGILMVLNNYFPAKQLASGGLATAAVVGGSVSVSALPILTQVHWVLFLELGNVPLAVGGCCGLAATIWSLATLPSSLSAPSTLFFDGLPGLNTSSSSLALDVREMSDLLNRTSLVASVFFGSFIVTALFLTFLRCSTSPRDIDKSTRGQWKVTTTPSQEMSKTLRLHLRMASVGLVVILSALCVGYLVQHSYVLGTFVAWRGDRSVSSAAFWVAVMSSIAADSFVVSPLKILLYAMLCPTIRIFPKTLKQPKATNPLPPTSLGATNVPPTHPDFQTVRRIGEPFFEQEQLAPGEFDEILPSADEDDTSSADDEGRVGEATGWEDVEMGDEESTESDRSAARDPRRRPQGRGLASRRAVGRLRLSTKHRPQDDDEDDDEAENGVDPRAEFSPFGFKRRLLPRGGRRKSFGKDHQPDEAGQHSIVVVADDDDDVEDAPGFRDPLLSSAASIFAAPVRIPIFDEILDDDDDEQADAKKARAGQARPLVDEINSDDDVNDAAAKTEVFIPRAEEIGASDDVAAPNLLIEVEELDIASRRREDVVPEEIAIVFEDGVEDALSYTKGRGGAVAGSSRAEEIEVEGMFSDDLSAFGKAVPEEVRATSDDEDEGPIKMVEFLDAGSEYHHRVAAEVAPLADPDAEALFLEDVYSLSSGVKQQPPLDDISPSASSDTAALAESHLEEHEGDGGEETSEVTQPSAQAIATVLVDVEEIVEDDEDDAAAAQPPPEPQGGSNEIIGDDDDDDEVAELPAATNRGTGAGAKRVVPTGENSTITMEEEEEAGDGGFVVELEDKKMPDSKQQEEQVAVTPLHVDDISSSDDADDDDRVVAPPVVAALDELDESDGEAEEEEELLVDSQLDQHRRRPHPFSSTLHQHQPLQGPEEASSGSSDEEPADFPQLGASENIAMVPNVDEIDDSDSEGGVNPAAGGGGGVPHAALAEEVDSSSSDVDVLELAAPHHHPHEGTESSAREEFVVVETGEGEDDDDGFEEIF